MPLRSLRTRLVALFLVSLTIAAFLFAAVAVRQFSQDERARARADLTRQSLQIVTLIEEFAEKRLHGEAGAPPDFATSLGGITNAHVYFVGQGGLSAPIDEVNFGHAPKGTEARHIAGVWWLMFAIAAIVYLVVSGLIIYSILRGRGRRSPVPDTNAPAPARFDDRMIVWGGVVVPLVILFVLAVVTVRTTNALRKPEPNPLRISVVGKQWWWAVDYPSINFTTANEIHLPAGRPVEIVYRAALPGLDAARASAGLAPFAGPAGSCVR